MPRLTAEKLKAILEDLDGIFLKCGSKPQQLKFNKSFCWNVDDRVAHVHWMRTKLPYIFTNIGPEMTNNWMGYIFGTLFAFGLLDVSYSRKLFFDNFEEILDQISIDVAQQVKQEKKKKPAPAMKRSKKSK